MKGNCRAVESGKGGRQRRGVKPSIKEMGVRDTSTSRAKRGVDGAHEIAAMPSEPVSTKVVEVVFQDRHADMQEGSEVPKR